MDPEERLLLYRTEYDILTIDRRRDLLEKVGAENGMAFKGLRRFERWGVYTLTAIFEYKGKEFVFVPGDTVDLGWGCDIGELDSTTRSKIRMDLQKRGSDDVEGVMRLLTTPLRKATISPMLVQVRAETFEGSYGDAVSNIDLPTSDEWEYLCGGGRNTLFQWGDAFDFKMGSDHYPELSGTSRPLEEPNFFGLVIASDPFNVEAVLADGPTFRGGDMGGGICAGYGPVIGYLPCTPHFKTVNRGPDGKVPDSFLVRRVIRLDDAGEPAEQPLEAAAEDGPSAESEADTAPDTERPFPNDYVFCASLDDDPDVPDTFAVRARGLFRGLIHWLSTGGWSLAEIEDQLRSRAERIASLQDETGYTMSPTAVSSVRDTFSDIISFYGLGIEPDSILDGEVWGMNDEQTSDQESVAPEVAIPDERLMMPRFDGLAMLERMSLMSDIASESGMRLVGVKTFSRWGRRTATGLFERDGREFVLIPGDTVVLGWDGFGDNPSEKDVNAAICRDLLPVREVTIGPMLVAVRAVPVGEYGESAQLSDAIDGLASRMASEGFSLPTSDEWAYMCSGGGRSLFPWGDSIGDEPQDPDQPNFFGLVIASDPSDLELVFSDAPALCGGDGVAMDDHPPCSPHRRPISIDDYAGSGRILFRPIVRLPSPGQADALSVGSSAPETSSRENELLEQCQGWHLQDDHERIVKTIEALPPSELTPQLISILARAYNNLGGPDDHGPCLKAIELLESVRDQLSDDDLWNYRLAYSYWMMDREPDALPYLRRAVILRPDDDDYRELQERCERALAMPVFRRCFRERAETAWRRFAEEMPEIERLLEHPNRDAVSDRIVETVSGILSEAIDGVAFEIGFNGERFELSLSPEADRVRLFEICEFIRRVPAEVRDRWDPRAGNRRKPDFRLNTDVGEICASDIWTEVEPKGDYISLTLHCPRLSGLMENKEDMVWWAVSSIMERVLGEIPAMAVLDGITVVPEPPGPDAVPMPQLPARLVDMGFNIEVDAEGYLSNSITYRPEPIKDPEADWRLDIYSGTSRCAPLVNGYLAMQNDGMDMLHRDGAVAGFIAYSLESFQGDDRAAGILGFRDRIEEFITGHAGRDAVEFIGGATGLYYGYVDLIAWDMDAAVDAAREFLSESEVARAGFHTFRRGPSSVIIVDRTEVVAPGSPILTPADIERFESYLGDVDGRYGAMLSDLISTLVNGINDGRFSSRQAESDLEVALWYSYACLNMGDYEHYWQATRWMPTSECNASGCGTWFYRYSCALMFCGRLDEAREYAERGTVEEPGYPWIWLQAAKLRAHFGDREGAMEAVVKGLELVPGDYEFLTLAREIEAGEGLERFEFHWIDPESDARLQAGEDPGAEEKLMTIQCIVTDPEGARWFRESFDHVDGSWKEDEPYCSFETEVRGSGFQTVFRTNIAAISKMDRGWFEEFRSRLYDGGWLSYARLMRRVDPLFKADGVLEVVDVGQDHTVTLMYRLHNGRMATVELDHEWMPKAEDLDE